MKKYLANDYYMKSPNQDKGNCMVNSREFGLMQEKANSAFIKKEIPEVLIIVVGGTIILDHTKTGYAYRRGLADRIRKIWYFHDEELGKEMNLADN